MESQVIRFEFGPFKIDTADRLLTRDGTVIPLTPKAIETLLVLLAVPMHVVDKAELMRKVWPDSFVEDGSLTRNIWLIRKALGELGEETDKQTYIETIPKRGYRFVGAVQEFRPDDHPLALGVAVRATARRKRSWQMAGLALL